MSTDAANTLAADLAAAQQQKRAAGACVACGPTAPELNIGLSYAPGTRVVDLVTGEEGVIVAGTISHSLIPATKPAGSQGTPGSIG